MNTPKPITVRIPHAKFWTLASGQPVHMNISVLKALRDAGIPAEGGVEFRAVTSGRCEMWNEDDEDGDRVCIYRWTPDQPKQPEEDDDL